LADRDIVGFGCLRLDVAAVAAVGDNVLLTNFGCKRLSLRLVNGVGFVFVDGDSFNGNSNSNRLV